MAIQSTQSLLTVLQRSQILSDREMEKVRASAAKYSDAKSLARALVAGKAVTRWQAGQLLAGRATFQLGKYRLLELLGRGGMGSVFAAEQVTLGRRVALKIISKKTGRDPEQLESFLEETRRIASLDHPNIVRAFDVDQEGERFFLVMEFVEGRDLQKLIEGDGPLEIHRAARFVRQAALGLAHAHARRMIHCDIKPANLIVTRDDVLKILDMGMARLIAADGSSSDSNLNIVGTIDYIAPEQALDAADLDHRVDVYSLGCAFYFMLTGRPPFTGGTLAQRILRHQTQAPPPIAGIRAGVPAPLVEICLKMMAKKPADRYQTAEEVARALEPWADPQGQGPDTRPPPIARSVPVAEPPGSPAPEKPANGNAGPDSVAMAAPSPGNDVKESSPVDDSGGVKIVVPDPETLPSESDGEESMSDGDDAASEIRIAVADSGSISARRGLTAGKRSVPAKEPYLASADSGLLRTFFADPFRKWLTLVSSGLLLAIGLVGGFFIFARGSDDAVNAVADSALATQSSTVGESEVDPSVADEGTLDLETDLQSLEETFARFDEPAAEDSAQQPLPPGDEPTGAAASLDLGAEPPTEEPGESDPDILAGTGRPQKTESEPLADVAAVNRDKEIDDEELAATGEPQEADEEPAPAPEKKALKRDPLESFPTVVDLPNFSSGDAPGEASKAPVFLGTIESGTDVSWQMLLIGGDKLLKGGREFVLAKTSRDESEASWSIQLHSPDDREDVARLWRDNRTLKFQWDDNAPGARANYLRNCFLQVRVDGNSKYTALTKPIEAEPVELDLLRGQSNSGVTAKWLPETPLLRFRFVKVDGVEAATFEPGDPVPARTPVALHVQYTDRYENDSTKATFRVLPVIRSSTVNVNLRLENPTPLDFQSLIGNNPEHQVRLYRDRRGNQRTELLNRARRARGPEAVRLNREVDAIDLEIWYLEFFLNAHKKATLHYQVVADLGGHELLLVNTLAEQP